MYTFICMYVYPHHPPEWWKWQGWSQVPPPESWQPAPPPGTLCRAPVPSPWPSSSPLRWKREGWAMTKMMRMRTKKTRTRFLPPQWRFCMGHLECCHPKGNNQLYTMIRFYEQARCILCYTAAITLWGRLCMETESIPQSAKGTNVQQTVQYSTVPNTVQYPSFMVHQSMMDPTFSFSLNISSSLISIKY